jgi:hypothetical protein
VPADTTAFNRRAREQVDMSRAPFVGLLTWFLVSAAVVAARPGLTASPASLEVSVSETPDAVRVRVQVVGEIEPGSLEVGFEGRKAIVSARDADGRPIRAQPVQLPAPVVEDGATADVDADDALVITLRKQRVAAQRDPEPSRR